MKKTVHGLLLLLALLSLPIVSWAQVPALVTVGFQDGSAYFANLLSRTETTVQVEFLHSGSRYEFDNQGYILSSTGKYKAGERVNLIDIDPKKESIYYSESLHSTDGTLPLYVGIMFGDGKIYYGVVEASAEASWFSIQFLHSGSHYTMHKEAGAWKVHSTDNGHYPPGHVLIDIFSLDEGGFFYFAQ